ncbi:hypothetical protein H6G72_02645 [Planktothricoides sp. FACHB-1370]|uniref:Uncharacterized protein n=2 Tax=Planktothricoides raciborskii TaxID=132608 RepID=A0AAU8JBZ8_9CYAN|nr:MULTISPECIES: hypothetical protein [Planktothricoides]MBD2542774.1 hypothetical protein [Planktothricoides raciborskii FACHB-1370]MBD2581479.1 hypothetical protein [Planktothricoides raciborskii FACHB-1261]
MEKYPEFIEQLRRDSGNPSMARIGDRFSATQKPGFFDRISKITADMKKPGFFLEKRGDRASSGSRSGNRAKLGIFHLFGDRLLKELEIRFIQAPNLSNNTRIIVHSIHIDP